ncbi:hypothetical protein DIPPA_23997 [Diplonema papillatum]|nr:hypothetical protein DIPPA_23997 [Diplonema papillatum]
MSTEGDSLKRRRSVGFSYAGLSDACHKVHLFLSEPPRELVCAIGAGVVNDPVTSSACGHHYCKQCIVPLLETSTCCPVTGCEVKLTANDLRPTPALTSKAKQLLVRCPNDVRGCAWSGPLADREPHAKICKQLLPITCEMCKRLIPRDKMARHASKDCPKLPAVCPRCDAAMLAVDVERHLSSECPKRSITGIAPPPTLDIRPSSPKLGVDEYNDVEVLKIPVFDPSASPRSSILRKAAWGEDSPPRSVSPSPLKTSASQQSIQSDGVCPRKEANDLADGKRLLKARRRKEQQQQLLQQQQQQLQQQSSGTPPQPANGPSGSASSPSSTASSPLNASFSTVSAGMPPTLSSSDLWAGVEKARDKLASAGPGGSSAAGHDEAVSLLLSAVSSLQDRVLTLEAENRGLKAALSSQHLPTSPEMSVSRPLSRITSPTHMAQTLAPLRPSPLTTHINR